ncbi:MAG: ABC transporter permease [Armatimonadota bacterium]|nr:ABC transporter permease [Armatimonadota bacterium]
MNRLSLRFGSRLVYSCGIYLFLLLLCVFFQVETGTFLTVRNLLNVLRQTSVNTILGVGMTMVIITGGIDLSVGAILALSAVLSTAVIMKGFPPPFPFPADVAMKPEWPLWASVPFAVLVAALTGALCGIHNALPIVKLRVPPFIATLAMFSVARGFAYIYVGGGQVGNLPERFTAAVGEGPLMPVVAISCVVVGHIVLSKTRFGRAIYAVGGNEQAAHLSGLAVGKVKFWVYVICGTLAGISGLLLAGRIGAGDPKSGMTYELNAIAAVVLGGTSLMGGVGSVVGTLLGAIVMGCLEAGLSLMGVQWFVQMVVKGYVILLAVIVDQTKKSRPVRA